MFTVTAHRTKPASQPRKLMEIIVRQYRSHIHQITPIKTTSPIASMGEVVKPFTWCQGLAYQVALIPPGSYSASISDHARTLNAASPVYFTTTSSFRYKADKTNLGNGSIWQHLWGEDFHRSESRVIGNLSGGAHADDATFHYCHMIYLALS